jgi:RHS repeat-associated protein
MVTADRLLVRFYIPAEHIWPQVRRSPTDLGDLRTRSSGGETVVYYHNYALGLAPIVAESEGTGLLSATRFAEGSYRRFYVYTPAGSLLYAIDVATGVVHFYHYDRMGSTLFLTDGDGDVSDAYAYAPYGMPLGRMGHSDQPFTYMGRYGVRWEPVGQLYDMRARWYDPATARFLSRDPQPPVLAVPQTLNPYVYAVQNPLRFFDPLGLEVGGVPDYMGSPVQTMHQAIIKWLRMLWQQGKRELAKQIAMQAPPALMRELGGALPPEFIFQLVMQAPDAQLDDLLAGLPWQAVQAIMESGLADPPQTPASGAGSTQPEPSYDLRTLGSQAARYYYYESTPVEPSIDSMGLRFEPDLQFSPKLLPGLGAQYDRRNEAESDDWRKPTLVTLGEVKIARLFPSLR